MNSHFQAVLRISAAALAAFVFQVTAAAAADLDLGPFCTGECKSILTLKADPSI